MFPKASDIVNADTSKLKEFEESGELPHARTRKRPRTMLSGEWDEDSDSDNPLSGTCKTTKTYSTSGVDTSCTGRIASDSRGTSCPQAKKTTNYCDVDECTFDVRKTYECERNGCSMRVHDVCVGLLFGYASKGKF